MDPNNSRWSHFGVAMFFFQNHHAVQCLVGYGPFHPMDLNPLSKLWKKLSNNALLSTYANEFMKVIKLVVIQIMGLWKLKEITWPWLSWKEDFKIGCVGIWILCFECLHNLFTQLIFLLYGNAIIVWIDEKEKRDLLAWIKTISNNDSLLF
jgi:hypothetical protein